MLKLPVKIYDGLVLPTHRELVAGAKELVLKKVMTDEEIATRQGNNFTEEGITIFDEDVDIYREDNNGERHLLAKLRKQVIESDIIKTGWEAYYGTANSTIQRGAAAGPIDPENPYWKSKTLFNTGTFGTAYLRKKGGSNGGRVNTPVLSTVMGFYDKSPRPFINGKCRLTSFSQKHFKKYKHGLPFIEAIDNCFKTLIPERYAHQKARADLRPHLRINNTAFSTVTVNRNFRTGLHMDDGDLRGGYGNLTVIERGSYHGGYTLFPQYGIGFNVRTGDFLAMDVHQWHCNTPLYETPGDAEINKKLPCIYKNKPTNGILGSTDKYTRMAFVCYLREKMVDCKDDLTFEYFKNQKYDHKNNIIIE